MNKLNHEDRERVNALFVLGKEDLFQDLEETFIIDYLSGAYNDDVFKHKFIYCAKLDYSIDQNKNQHKLDAIVGQLVSIAGLTYYNWPEISQNIYDSIHVLKAACDELNEEFLEWKIGNLLTELSIQRAK